MRGIGSGHVRHAVRGFARDPLFTLATVVTLALGIGATTAVYSVVDGVLLEPLPYDDPDALVTMIHSAPGLDLAEVPNARAMYVVYREGSRSFDAMALHSSSEVTLTGLGDPERITAHMVTPSLFEVLRVEPALGRTFTEEEGVDGTPLVVLSHAAWTRRFGADPDVLGRTVTLSGTSFEIVGVMPESFAFPSPAVELWHPMKVDPATVAFTGFNELGIGRLAEGVTPEAAQEDIQSLIPRLVERFPGITPALLEQTDLRAIVRPWVDDVVGDVRSALWILLGTVAFVLLIACANVANLMLVRAESRRREVAVRSALGAGRGDLVGQFMTESLVLASAGALLGVGLGSRGLALLRRLGADTVPRLDRVGMDGSVLAVTLAVTCLCALAFGLVPVLRHRSVRPADDLRDGSRGSTGGRRGLRARELLVAGQVALSLVLLVGSGLMVRSFAALRDVDPGFESAGVLTFSLALPTQRYDSEEAVATFHRNFLERVRGLPGVEAAGAVSRLPVGDMAGINGFFDAADPPPPGELAPVLETRAATPGYFEALGIPVRQGRTPTWSDGTDGEAVVVLSEKAAAILFGEASVAGPGGVIGEQVVTGVSLEDVRPPARVVGLVGDVHNVSLAEPPMGTVYFAPVQGKEMDQRWLTQRMSYAVRATGTEPLSLVAGVRDALRALDPDLPLASIGTMEARLAGARVRTVFTMTMLGIAAAMGLILGAVGLYGVISHVTARRTREIGLRMALGAEASRVRGMVLRRGMLMTGVGVLAGLAAAWGVSHTLESLLYGVSAVDPVTYAGVTAVLVATSFVATWIPAWRASRLDAMAALRQE